MRAINDTHVSETDQKWLSKDGPQHDYVLKLTWRASNDYEALVRVVFAAHRLLGAIRKMSEASWNEQHWFRNLPGIATNTEGSQGRALRTDKDSRIENESQKRKEDRRGGLVRLRYAVAALNGTGVA